MHSINIFLEWQLLKGFEKTEKLLQDKLQNKKIERLDISNKVCIILSISIILDSRLFLKTHS